ncbi:ABC transporter permease [Lactococcus hodotermopsidis]|uniref:ABC transporter permease n=1 Tax=Pseudolactococcus hodotermopsidis TaxID=2709157 RepID=A0A6A0BCV2_9LACT|nr:YfhO family protein [Lactococcus hodotermopsidis]GFH43240.1 ABC transporter permease [Lactococcus hodotermopsidis]
MSAFIKKNKIFLALSFLIPLLIMAINFAFLDIYWGSDTTVLAGDAYHQYVAFHSLFSHILHNDSGFFYTFTSGLGLNFLSFSSYYLGSFLMPLTYFFDASNMPDCLYLLTLLKFGLIGLSSFSAFKNMYLSLSNWLILSLSSAYTLMSFIVNQSEIIMWLDVFIWIPLIIWGLHSLMDKQKRTLYFVSLTLLFIQNYYFGFMLAIFLTGYFFARLTFNGWSLSKLIDFAITSILSGIASLIMILPMYLDLKANGEAFSKVNARYTENAWYFDIFAKNFISSYDTTQYGAVPTIYIGLLTFLLAVLFFATKTIRLRTKFAFLSLIAFIITSFYLRPLDLFWQGMHTPNMFLHRYSFVFSILIVIMAAETLTRLSEIRLRWLIFLSLLMITGFTATVLSKHYNYITSLNISLTILFGIAYLIILIANRKNWLTTKQVPIFMMIFMLVEIGINTSYQLNGISDEWHYSSRNSYDENTKKILPAAKVAMTDKTFYRMDETHPDTANDGMKFGYHSLSQFSSVRNRKSSSTLNLLGFRSDGTNLNLRYPLNTVLMDSIFGIRYNLNTREADKYGFSATGTPHLSENSYALAPAIFVENGYFDVKLKDKKIVANQTAFVNQLAGTSSTFFSQFYTDSEKTNAKITGGNDRITLTQKGKDEMTLSYTVTAPANGQAYLKFADVTYENTDAEYIKVTINNIENAQTQSLYINTYDTGSLINLGYFETASKVEITLDFPQNKFINFDTTEFWSLNTKIYSSVINKLKETPVTVKQIKNGLRAAVKTKTTGDLFLSIPYDKGWTAKVDGKIVPIKQAQTGFMKVPLSSIGTHQIELNFIPQGFKIGILCFISAIFLFVIYNKKKHTSLN